MVSDNIESNIRLAKYISSSGLYSRKEAEELILAGKVKVNGEVYREFVIRESEALAVEIEKKLIKPSNKIEIYKFHKISGTVTTSKDPQNRSTIYDSIRKGKYFSYKLKTVGRLDYNTEGLLLLTNQGEIARILELPVNEFERVYEVKIWGDYNLDSFRIDLSKSLVIKGIYYKALKMKILNSSNNNHKIQLTLKEGKNREIRKILAHFGFKVKSLKRIKFGPIELGNLPKESLIELSELEYSKIKPLLRRGIL